MDTAMIIELIGYIGSALVVVSMLMTSVKKLRIVNCVGCVIFAAYALIIRSYPTAVMNIALVGINVYNLYKLAKIAKSYSVFECFEDESLIQLFLKGKREDINKFFPEFEPRMEHKLSYLVCRESEPIGILIGKIIDADTLKVELDYTIPEYRDCSVGTFLYDYLEKHWKIKSFVFGEKTVNHEKYLMNMGFIQNGSEYVKKVD